MTLTEFRRADSAFWATTGTYAQAKKIMDSLLKTSKSQTEIASIVQINDLYRADCISDAAYVSAVDEILSDRKLELAA